MKKPDPYEEEIDIGLGGEFEKDKDTPLQLACQARYGEIDWENLTLDTLKEKNSFGETLLHHLIRVKPLHSPWDTDHKNPETEYLRVQSQLDKIPKELLCDEILKQKTNEAESIYLLLAKSGNLQDISKNLITKSMLLEEPENGESILFEIISKKQLELVDPKFIEEGILLEECKQLNTTYLHICAMLGELKKIPKELWMDKLGLKDKNGSNLLHWAADGVFEGYPVNEETIKLMKEKNKEGNTPLHNLRDITTLPREFIDKETLYSKNKNGQSAIYSIARRTPEKFVQFWVEMKTLNEKELLEKDCRGEYALDNLFIKYYPKENHENYKKFVAMLSKEALIKAKNIEGLTHIKKAQDLINDELKKRMVKALGKNPNTIEL
jgi:hypothetical protein